MVSVLSISPLVHTPESSSSWWSGRLLAHMGVFSMPALAWIRWEGAGILMSGGVHYSVVLPFTTGCPYKKSQVKIGVTRLIVASQVSASYPDYKLLTVVKIQFCELWGVTVYGCSFAELQEIARKMQKRRYKKEEKKASKQCAHTCIYSCTYHNQTPVFVF